MSSTPPTITSSSIASSIIVGDPVSASIPTRSSTSTTTQTVYAPQIIGYSPGPDPSSTLNCETPDYTTFLTSTAGGNKIGCRKIGTTNQRIYATSCIPAESQHVVVDDPYLVQCGYGITQNCNKFAFSDPDVSFYSCFTIANQTETKYLWPEQWSALYADAVSVSSPSTKSEQASMTAGPAASSDDPDSGDEAEDNPSTSVPVIAGASAVAAIAFTAWLVLLAVIWRKRTGRRRVPNEQPAEQTQTDVEGTDNLNVTSNLKASEGTPPQELSGGEAHIHELEGTTIASPRTLLDGDDGLTGTARTDTKVSSERASQDRRDGVEAY